MSRSGWQAGFGSENTDHWTLRPRFDNAARGSQCRAHLLPAWQRLPTVQGGLQEFVPTPSKPRAGGSDNRDAAEVGGWRWTISLIGACQMYAWPSRVGATFHFSLCSVEEGVHSRLPTSIQYSDLPSHGYTEVGAVISKEQKY